MRRIRDYSRVCVDCVHHELGMMTDYNYGTPAVSEVHFCNGSRSLITGLTNPGVTCVAMRDVKGQCGPRGRLFEAIKKTEAAE